MLVAPIPANSASLDQYVASFVEALGWYKNSSKVFIAMEYLPLGDLQSYLRTNGPLTESDARVVIYQIISAVEQMHSHQIAHRDLKPAVSALCNQK